MPDRMLQGLRLMRQLRGKVAYVICEALDGYSDRATTCTKLVAGEAVAAVSALNVEEARREPGLPMQIKSTLTMSDSDWKEVMAIARINVDFMEAVLQRPQWSHLRRSST